MAVELIISIVSLVASIIIGVMQISSSQKQKLLIKQIQETNLKINQLEFSVKTTKTGIIRNSNAEDINNNQL